MKKILAFAGSNSSTSINHTLVEHIASLLTESDLHLLKLTDHPLPLYSEDLEQKHGFPDELEGLLDHIRAADGLIISVNEHNGTVSAFFKNVLDWVSRKEYKFLAEKKVLLMSASPGKRGGLSAYEYTRGVLPRFGAEVKEGINFPSFSENFSTENMTITDPVLAAQVSEVTHAFVDTL